jgi:phosphopantothenoylcysteine decarboxylase/phosphopantothenate--cysteine ligase
MHVDTAAALRNAVMAEIESTDVFVSAAAVSDYRVAVPSPQKLKKKAGAPVIELVENPDVLAEVSRVRGPRIIVGFAAETDTAGFEAELARKATSKGVDLLVGNIVGESEGFGNNETAIVLVNREGVRIDSVSGSKSHVASHILDHVSRQKDASR